MKQLPRLSGQCQQHQQPCCLPRLGGMHGSGTIPVQQQQQQQQQRQSLCARSPQSRTLHKVRAAAAAEQAPPAAVQADEQAEWAAVVANAEFMLHDVQNESFAEQLRERRRYLREKGMGQNFWLVSEPAWLDERFPDDAKKVRRPCVALISTDKKWIHFMKLRLDRVLRLDLGSLTPEEALKSTAPPPEFPPLDTKKWTAPYPPYAPGWWKVFSPEQ